MGRPSFPPRWAARLLGLAALAPAAAAAGADARQLDAISLFQYRPPSGAFMRLEETEPRPDAAPEERAAEPEAAAAQPADMAAALERSATQMVAANLLNVLLVNLPSVSAALARQRAASPGDACTADDRKEMSTAFAVMNDVLDIASLPARLNLLEQKCAPDRLLAGGVDYVRAEECLSYALNVSSGCSACQAKSLRLFFGRDPQGERGMGCVPECLAAEEPCQKDAGSKSCSVAVSECLSCAQPALADLMSCHGFGRGPEAWRPFEECTAQAGAGKSKARTRGRHIVDYISECVLSVVPTAQ